MTAPVSIVPFRFSEIPMRIIPRDAAPMVSAIPSSSPVIILWIRVKLLYTFGLGNSW
jgi:hypothetical protein